jgi:multiple sugar transport system ATP-binding protein
MASVSLDRVRKVYGGPDGHVAVDDATFQVTDGEFMVLVGPSGCGKSTMLRMIAGLETATAGEIRIGDRVVNDVPPQDRDIAMVFQSYALYPHMTVRENLAFGLKLRKLPRPEVAERVERAARILDITAILERRPKQLSGGQRQRVAVGRAIVRDPRVFLFDEPLSNLDAKLRVQMRAELSSLHRRLAATMIYVTHDQVEAMTLGDRIVVLDDGVIQQIDTPLELYDRPANRFVAGFLGSPAMNFIPGQLERNGGFVFRAEGDAFRVELTDPWIRTLEGHDGSITLGIRPENLLGPGDRRDAPLSALTATIDAIEPLGNEVFIHANAGDHRLTARVAPQSLPPAGQPAELALDLQKLHFFDGATGVALQRAPA